MAVTDVSVSELRERAMDTAYGVYIFASTNTVESAAILLAAAQARCAAVPLRSRLTEDEERGIRARIEGRRMAAGVYIATSGSQGEPKFVHLRPEALVFHGRAVNTHLRVTAEDRWLACLPFFHVGGMAIIIRCALAKASIRITESADASLVSDALDGCTLASLVPTTLRRVLALRSKLPASVRAVVLGGGPVPQDLVQACPQVLPTYGLTEAGSMVTCARPDCHESERFSAGLPIEDAAVCIEDEKGRKLPAREIGRIVVQSPGPAREYINNENETARTFRAGWIVTEDAGWLDEHGCLHVVGRRDRLLVSGGENIALDEIEAAARELPNIRDALCIDLPDHEWGQVVAVVIESDQALTLEALRESLRARLASFKLPRRVLVVAQLPLLSNGKPDYAAARKLFG